MELVKSEWTQADGAKFIKYLEGLARPNKVEWTRKIINTSMPLLAIAVPDLRKIAKQISKGNYLSFLNLKIVRYYENVTINGFLIGYIKDFEIYRNKLLQYLENVDNWSNCDLLEYRINDKNSEKFFNLSLELINEKKVYARRTGITIWFKYINSNHLQQIFEIINSMQEDEYYVNMCVAWFLAECFIKQKELTLKFLQQNNLNKFTINKVISKCRDSYRVSKEDKQMLLKFKK